MKIRRVLKWTAIAVPLALIATFLIAYFRSTNVCDDPRPAPPAHPMKAIVYCDYGTADVLRLEEVEKPEPAEHQILIKVHAVGLNPLDWHFMRGTPYVMRLDAGLRKPKSTRLGVDFAGTVEAVGAGVTRFKAGDEVFGGRNGALAEYVVAGDDRAIVGKPASLTFEQAAAVPIAAVTALQALRDKGHVQPGQKVLINGASGGVGTFAVQIAKSLGATVTGVCSGRNADMVRSLGAEHVIDYTKEDFTKGGVRYDVILDNVGNRSLAEFRSVLTEKGKYVLIGGGGPDAGNWIGPLGRPVAALLSSPFISQDMGMFLAQLNGKDLTVLSELMVAGKVTPVIDKTYPLSEAAEAIHYLEEGHARGKVIVKVD